MRALALAALSGLAGAGAAGLAAAQPQAEPAALPPLIIHHFDVGQGDATLLQHTGSGRTLLIDAGNRGAGEKVLAPTLRALGLDRLTYFLATHYDADHIGGFDELGPGGVRVTEAVFDRGDRTDRRPTTPTGRRSQYGEYLDAAGGLRRTLTADCAPAPIDLGTGVEVTVVAGAGRFLHRGVDGAACAVSDADVPDHEDNDLSLALLVRYGAFSYFIGGDLTGGGNRTTPMERFAAPWIGDVDVLKVDHHGSMTSSEARFLELLAPEVAIISVGDGGVNLRYRLPRQEVLDRLAALESEPVVFLTNKGEGGTLRDAYVENRHIVLITDGRSYVVNGVTRAVDERARAMALEADLDRLRARSRRRED